MSHSKYFDMFCRSPMCIHISYIIRASSVVIKQDCMLPILPCFHVSSPPPLCRQQSCRVMVAGTTLACNKHDIHKKPIPCRLHVCTEHWLHAGSATSHSFLSLPSSSLSFHSPLLRRAPKWLHNTHASTTRTHPLLLTPTPNTRTSHSVTFPHMLTF